MAKKKKFGLDDVLDLTQHAATMVANFKTAQTAAKESKETSAFKDGNKTNLPAAEGGVSKKKSKSNTGIGSSQLALDEIDKYRNY